MYLQRLACIYQSAECSRALCMIVNFFKKGKKIYRQQLNIEFFQYPFVMEKGCS